MFLGVQARCSRTTACQCTSPTASCQPSNSPWRRLALDFLSCRSAISESVSVPTNTHLFVCRQGVSGLQHVNVHHPPRPASLQHLSRTGWLRLDQGAGCCSRGPAASGNLGTAVCHLRPLQAALCTYRGAFLSAMPCPEDGMSIDLARERQQVFVLGSDGFWQPSKNAALAFCKWQCVLNGLFERLFGPNVARSSLPCHSQGLSYS